MEHTGIYNNHLINYLHSKKANAWVEHPVNIKESLGMIRGKNDKVDAKRIAFYAYKNRDEVRLWLPKRDVIQKLDRLTATRNRLIKVRKILQSPLTDSQDFITKKDHDDARRACQKTMDSLKKDLQNIEKLIKEVIQSDIYLKELFEFIESVKGIGPTIALKF
jgi:transposase